MALGIKSVCMSSFCDFGAKLYKISGMLRTKVYEIGCYYRKKMIFSTFSKNHFQKSRVGPENRFRIFRFLYSQNKKNAGHRPESSPAAPRNPFCLQIGNAKVHFSNQKTRKKWHFSKVPPHSPSQKKRQRDPKQATSDLFKTKTTNPSSRHPKCTTANETIPKEKQFQIFRPDNAYGIRTWRHTLPSIFQKLMLQALKINNLQNIKNIHFCSKWINLFNYLIFNNIIFWQKLLSNFHLFTICKTLSVENNLIG